MNKIWCPHLIWIYTVCLVVFEFSVSCSLNETFIIHLAIVNIVVSFFNALRIITFLFCHLTGSGIPFGEVALMSDDCIRTATIIAEEPTDLLVVDRALYNRCVCSVLAAEFQEKKDFIDNNPLFKSWIPKYKKQLAMAMYKETWPYDSVLVRQGDPVSNIYFVIR